MKTKDQNTKSLNKRNVRNINNNYFKDNYSELSSDNNLTASNSEINFATENVFNFNDNKLTSKSKTNSYNKEENNFSIAEITTKYWKDQIPQLNENNEDSYFPPDIRSLLAMDKDYNYLDENGEENAKALDTDNIVWKRIGKLMANYSIFVDKIESSDVKQGSIGNCYFLSVLSSFTTDKHRFIFNLFKTKAIPDNGVYEIVLYIDGEWQIVFVDDYFPINKSTGEFVFAKPNGNELWVILLEKAFAKVNGGYVNMNAGYVSDPIYIISGFPTETLFSDEIQERDLFNKILKAQESKSLMCCSSRNDESIKEKGLVKGHSYTIMNVIEDSDPTTKINDIRLLKLRNPWGFFSWNGAWSDSSEEWTEYLKLKYELDEKDDGIFYISIEDFTTYYEHTNISYILYGGYVKNYIINYNNFPYIFNFELLEKGKVCFSIIKKHWRYNNRKLKYKSRPFSFVIVKYSTKKKVLSIDGQYRVYENVEYIDDLDVGKYFLIILCPIEHYSYDNDKPNMPIKCIFRICTKSQYKSKFAGIDTDYMFIQYIIINNIKHDYENLIDKCKTYFTMPCKVLEWSGLKCFVIVNKKSYLIARVNIKDFKNVMMFPIHKDIDKKPLKIKPYETVAIIAQFSEIYDSVKCDIDLNINVSEMVKRVSDTKNNYANLNNKSNDNYETKLLPSAKEKKHVNNKKILKESKTLSQKNNNDKINTNNINNNNNSKHTTKNLEFDLNSISKITARKHTKILASNKKLPYYEQTESIKSSQEDIIEIDDDPENTAVNSYYNPNYEFDNLEYFTYCVIDENEINNVPTYENIYSGKDFELVDVKDIEKKYKKNFKRLNEFINLIETTQIDDNSNIFYPYIIKLKERLKQSDDKNWATGKIKDGSYAGKVNNSNRPEGPGFFLLNSKDMYLGIWLNGYLEGYGMYYNKVDKLIFEGLFENDVKLGLGRFYHKNNEIYEGEFSNNVVSGNGVYYFKDNRTWVGYFIDNNKENKGIMIYPNLSKIEIAIYSNNVFLMNTSITSSLLNKFKENNSNIKLKMHNLKEVVKTNNILIENNSQIIKELKEKEEEDFDIIEDEEEKKRILKLKKIKEFSPFMFNLVMQQKKENDKNEIIVLKDDKRKAYYLGQVNEYYAYEQSGCLKYNTDFCLDCCAFRKPEHSKMLVNKDANNNNNNNNNNNKNKNKRKKNKANTNSNNLADDLKLKALFKKAGKIDLLKDDVNEYNKSFSKISEFNINEISSPKKLRLPKKLTFKTNNTVINSNDNTKESNKISKTQLINNKNTNNIKEIINTNDNENKLTENINLENNTNTKSDEIHNKKTNQLNSINSFINNKNQSNQIPFTPKSQKSKIDVNNQQNNNNNNNNNQQSDFICSESHVKAKYMLSFFKNDKPEGKIYFYSDNQSLVYKGSAFKELIPQGKGEKYLFNGDIYNGDFIKGKMHGKGTLTYANGDKLVGNFEDDVPSGEGTMYEKDNPIPYTINFKGGVKVIQKPVLKPFVEIHLGAITNLYKKYPVLISIMLTYLKPHPDNNKLRFKHMKFEYDIEYIGQVDENNNFCGRGIMNLGNNSIEKYYVGYFNENKRTTYGFYFNEDYDLLYEGEFEDNCKSGKGRDFISKYQHFDGEFRENNRNGKGLYFFGDKGRIEGYLVNSFFDGNCKFIYEGMKLIEYIECDDGNVINSHKAVKINNSEINRLNSLRDKFKDEFGFYINKIEELSKSEDFECLLFDKIKEKNGYYIGEINFNNKPHGRGVFHYKIGKYYVGYWVNGFKEGYGKEYNEDKLFYKGNFRRDNKVGYGVYYNCNKMICGCFTVDGCSNYVVCKEGKRVYTVGRYLYHNIVGKVFYIVNNRSYLKYYNNLGKEIKNISNCNKKKFVFVENDYIKSLNYYIKSFKYNVKNKYYIFNKNLPVITQINNYE